MGLGPLVTEVNPLSAVALTFLRRPHIDFSLAFSETAGPGAHNDVVNVGLAATPQYGLGLSSALQHVVSCSTLSGRLAAPPIYCPRVHSLIMCCTFYYVKYGR